MTVDNILVNDAYWADMEKPNASVEKVLSQKGYHELGTNVFVPEEDAYEYAFDRCMNGTEEEQKEFKEMLVEWFYSGNWVKEK
jgi:tRNA nucleotidyltransferase (CCA-adding enzyme)